MEPLDAALARFDEPRRAILHGLLQGLDGLIDAHAGAVVGWATVDLERAAAELAAVAEPLADDELLGARAALARRPAAAPLVLLEPRTEGRLAGSLARFGEGPAVVYVTASTAGPGSAAPGRIRLSHPAAGPFGRAFLVGGPAGQGPFVVLSERAEAGTIGG